jgi:hypothetical protein
MAFKQASWSQFKQSAVHPHRLTPARMAQIRAWQALGAEARRGRRTAVPHPAGKHKPPRSGNGVVGAYGKATAWGVQKLVMPVGVSTAARFARRQSRAPIAAAKNQVPGYNVVQPIKATARPRTSLKRR